jgi:putative transposase
MLAIGDVRDVADGKRMGAHTQQKIALWSHGKVRHYITYKAQAAGISIERIDEHETSKTCPRCAHQYKPRGRVYRCPTCGLVAHRDVVGAVNIRSRKVHGQLAKILLPHLSATTYRYPAWQGQRSPLDTGCPLPTRGMARVGSSLREAAGL